MANQPQNIATWGMTLLLDLLGLKLVLEAGTEKPYMQIGWVFAAACIVVAILAGNNPWQWTIIETISLGIALAAMIVWLTMDAKVALPGYILATYVSFFPLMVDYWHKPQPQTAWVWLWTIVACLLAILAEEEREYANMCVPFAAILLNTIMTILCFI